MAKKREVKVRVYSSVPKFVKDELDRLTKQGHISESHLVMMMIVHALPWATKLMNPEDREQAISSRDYRKEL